MPLLGRDEILAASRIPTEDVEVPEWGGSVKVRGLNAHQRALVTGTSLGVADASPAERAESWARLQDELVAMCVVNEDDSPMFTAAEIAAMEPAIVSRLMSAANRLSGLGPAAVEAAAGNSDAAPSDDSGSG